MSGQFAQEEKPGRKKLRVGQVFKMSPGEGQEDKKKTQLKKTSEPYKQKIELEKQAKAESYWDDEQTGPETDKNPPQLHHALSDSYFTTNPHMNLHNLNKFGSLMDEITFDEEEFKNDPEKYIQTLPDEYMQEFEDIYHSSRIAEIIDDLDEDEINKFDEKLKNCSCCHGYVYKCKGKICYNLGICQCMARNEMEKEAVEHYIAECTDCKCCRGYVYTCLGPECQDKIACVCFEEE